MIYEPREDSYLLESEVKKCARTKKVLDMGSGSGIQAQAAISAGAESVLAVDIDAESVKHLKKEGLTVKKSDLFDNVEGKFDLIIFNPPYLPQDSQEDKQSRKATTGGKEGDEVIVNFLKKASAHLENQGIILLLVSSLTPKKEIEKLLKTKKMKKTIIAKQKLFFELLEVWKIKNSHRGKLKGIL